MSKLPEYLESVSYRNPGDDPSDPSLFQYSNNTPLEFFQWLQTQPEKLALFHKRMANSVTLERASQKAGFASIFPFESELGKDLASPDEVVLVDIGGGYGQALQDIRTYLPELKGRMVLEDLEATVKGHLPLENVDIVPYNFFESEQPVKGIASFLPQTSCSRIIMLTFPSPGARAYLLRHVLADWCDADCRKILLNAIPALKEGHSRILLSEAMLPPTNAPAFGAMMDIRMMQYKGMGRKERQWRELLGSVGLEIVKIWPGHKWNCVMEAVPRSWLGK